MIRLVRKWKTAEQQISRDLRMLARKVAIMQAISKRVGEKYKQRIGEMLESC